MKTIDKKYEIQHSLGGGAFSDVYLVDSPSGPVALKLLKTEVTLNPTEKNLACFKNEFSILKNLNHPNIARILDFGLDEELLQYYFTTEYVQGSDIYTATGDASVETIIDLFVQAFRALEYLHSYRVFHFDIKAANVLVTDEKKVKLIDFGLASIDPQGKLMGTPSYMPPEIIRKEKPDGRADIYSLGVLWYYCLARKNPFRSSDSNQTIENQKSMTPPAPSSFRAEIPKHIDQIISRMLEKRPEKRYERASQIIKELNLLGGHSFELETSETLLSYIPEKGRFIGRKIEIQEIKNFIERLSKGEANHLSFVVTGKRGTGKKRILDEARYHAQLNNISVVWADGHNLSDVEACIDKLNEHLKKGGNITAFIIDSCEWLEATEVVFEKLKNTLSLAKAYSKIAPTLIALGIDEDSSLAADLESLTDSKITLENFNREELQEYIVNLTGLAEVPNYLIEEIFKRTEGNPLFVTEIAKSLISSGALFDSKGRWKETSFMDIGVDFGKALPESLKDLLMDQYYDLSPEQKEILDYICIVRRPASSFELLSWTETKEISKPIELLVMQDLLSRQSAYHYYLRNELLSGYICEDLDPIKKERYHDRIADYLINADGNAEEIIYHIGRGSDHRQAFEKTFEAGCKYLKEGLGKKAIENLSIASSHHEVISLEEKIELNMKMGEAYLISQDYKNALQYFNAAEERLHDLGGGKERAVWQIDTLIKIGGTYIKLGEWNKAGKSFSDAKILALKTGTDHSRSLILENWSGYLAYQKGKLDEAEKIYTGTREKWLTLSDAEKPEVTNNELATVLIDKGEYKEAIAILKDDLEYFEKIKDELLIGRRLYNIAKAYEFLGEYENAIDFFQKTAELSRGAKDIENLFYAYNELGNIFNITSELDKSRKYYERARNLSFQSGDFKGHAAISINIGLIENKLGNIDLAYYELLPAIIYLRNLPQKSSVDWQVLARGELEMIEVLLSKGEFEEAAQTLASTKESAKQIPEYEAFKFWLLLSEAHLMKKTGDNEGFKAIAEKMKAAAKSEEENAVLSELTIYSEEEMEKAYKIILEINKLINSETSLEKIYDLVIENLVKHLGIDTAAIALVGEKGTVNIPASNRKEDADFESAVIQDSVKETVKRNDTFEIADTGSETSFPLNELLVSMGIRSIMCVPVHAKSKIIGALYLESRKSSKYFDGIPSDLIRIFTDQIGISINRQKEIEELSNESSQMQSKIEEMSDQLKRYAKIMDESVHGFPTKFKYENIIGRSKVMLEVLQTVDKITDTDISVLITGESGTGKELIARALHFNSRRKDAPFVTINCGAIPSNLVESELFGYKAGAFTGATHDKKGLFEEASGGTIFLDEITEIETSLQVKLLRVIQEREFHRIGDTKPRSCDIRIISATNKEIDQELKNGRFREDLYWRLCQMRLHLPPLRERREDIPLLVKHFLSSEDIMNKKIAPTLLKHLIEYNWPGNIRELENLISVAAALSEGDIIDEKCIPENYGLYKFISGQAAPPSTKPAEIKLDEQNKYRSGLKWGDYENLIYAKAYQANEYRARPAAKELGVSPTTMYAKISELNLDDKTNPIYQDEFIYTHGKSLRSYTLPVFDAALRFADNKAARAIENLGISQGFFYKIIKAK